MYLEIYGGLLLEPRNRLLEINRSNIHADLSFIFVVSNFVESFHYSDVPPFSREKRDRMKYFSQQRVSKGRMKRKISTLRVMLRVTRVQGKNNGENRKKITKVFLFYNILIRLYKYPIFSRSRE